MYMCSFSHSLFLLHHFFPLVFRYFVVVVVWERHKRTFRMKQMSEFLIFLVFCMLSASNGEGKLRIMCNADLIAHIKMFFCFLCVCVISISCVLFAFVVTIIKPWNAFYSFFSFICLAFIRKMVQLFHSLFIPMQFNLMNDSKPLGGNDVQNWMQPIRAKSK